MINMNSVSLDRSRIIITFALQSRVFIFFLQVFFNYLVPDHRPDVFNPPMTSNYSDDALVNTFFDGLTKRWDAIYYMFISQYGYYYENTLVFFPLFPFFVKIIASPLSQMCVFISEQNIFNITAVLLNAFLFCAAASQLYKLSYKVLKSEYLAFRAAQLFCVNPASIFFSAAYSESLYSFLTFTGLSYLESGYFFKCACIFMLCSATRSNALINSFFIIYIFIHQHFYHYKFTNPNKSFSSYLKNIFSAIIKFLYLSLLTLISISLFISHQVMGYVFYCSDERHRQKSKISFELLSYGIERKYNVPGGVRPLWCSHLLPLHYSSIQQNHWNIGLFKYYQLKQIPNFLLASPIIIISFCLFISYFVSNNLYCIFLGFPPKSLANKKLLRGFKLSKKDPIQWGVFADRCFVYATHLASLTIFALIFMHVQVSTRLLCSSCPIFFWFLAEVSLSDEEMMILKYLQDGKKDEKDEGVEGCTESSSLRKRNKNLKISQNKTSYKGDNESSEGEKRLQKEDEQKGSQDDEELTLKDLEKADRGLLEEIMRESEVLDWRGAWYNRIISVYFHLYLFIGVALFCNFFPWT